MEIYIEPKMRCTTHQTLVPHRLGVKACSDRGMGARSGIWVATSDPSSTMVRRTLLEALCFQIRQQRRWMSQSETTLPIMDIAFAIGQPRVNLENVGLEMKIIVEILSPIE